MLGAVRDIRRAGSAALDLAWVACGRLDGFFESGIHHWDYAGGMLLVPEAGGLFAVGPGRSTACCRWWRRGPASTARCAHWPADGLAGRGRGYTVGDDESGPAVRARRP